MRVPEPAVRDAVRPAPLRAVWGNAEPRHHQLEQCGIGTLSTALRSTATQPAVFTPRGFADVQDIGKAFTAGRAVEVRLDDCDADLVRRVVDFASGMTFVGNGRLALLWVRVGRSNDGVCHSCERSAGAGVLA